MLKRFRRTEQLVRFHEAPGELYSAARRHNSIIDSARQRALLRGWKLV